MNTQSAESLLGFAESAGPKLRGVEANATFAQLDQQYGDLLSAIQWFIDQGRTDDALRLAIALVPLWMATKRLAEGSTWLERALAAPGGHDTHRGRALFNAGYLAFWRGDDELSSSLQDQALEVSRSRNDTTVIALALVGKARIALRSNVDEARKLCREALAVTEGTSERDGRSSAMHVLATASQMAGDLNEAREMMNARIALARETGNLATISIESNNLSMVERQLGNIDAAEALAREALDISHRRGDGVALPWNLNGLAAVAAQRGQYERAANLIGIADAAMKAAGGAWPPDELVHYERTVASVTEAMGSEAFERIRVSGRSMPIDEGVDFALGTGAGS